MIKILSFILILLCPVAAFCQPLEDSGDELMKLGSHLNELELFDAPFNQTKIVATLKNPLSSRGRFVYAKNKGIFWETLSPFLSAMILTPETIAVGRTIDSLQPKSSQADPQLKAFSEVLLKLFSGNFPELDKYFEATFSGTFGENWSVELRPRNEHMKQIIDQITLRGKQVPTSFALQETSGDQTIVEFYEAKVSSFPLSEELEQIFSHVR